MGAVDGTAGDESLTGTAGEDPLHRQRGDSVAGTRVGIGADTLFLAGVAAG